MERFVKILNDFYLLRIFEKHSILDVWQGSEYTSAKTHFVKVLPIFQYFLDILQHQLSVWNPVKHL